MSKFSTVRAFAWCLLTALLLANSLKAQTAKADFEKAIVADFCDSFSKATPRLTSENLDTEVGLVIVSLFSKYNEQIRSEWTLNTSDSKDLGAVGEKIGQLAAINCPSFQAYIKANLKDITSARMDGVKTYSGKIVRIEGKPFTYLLVQNSQGRMDKFYWMEFFSGADKLTSPAASFLNKPVQIAYREMEVYQADEKEYKAIKVITKATF